MHMGFFSSASLERSTGCECGEYCKNDISQPYVP